ncbi:diguanylate cyclase domain-containing protein [Motiliproteus sp. SC1-56]|uniref:diguanylate cyclase domain-containing protein n=1 Tax=Motiliproteus sp. SC1-56 TaxID=2799565 RepID=UPI001A8C6080|nr:diguanylate cyclase [Motiliproteus sp. SC1-56]
MEASRLRRSHRCRAATAARLVWMLWVLLAPSLATAQDKAGAGLTPVRLQLQNQHQFQFAGYYAAKAQGYYREAGLAVEFVPASPDHEPIESVLGGHADYGVANAAVLQQRLQGRPLVALAAVFQHSGAALIARQDKGVQALTDLTGRRVMLKPRDVELIALLRSEGVSVSEMILTEHTFDIEPMVEGRVAATSGYLPATPYELEARDIPYAAFYPAAYGLGFYSDILFASEQQLRAHPKQARAFRAASLRGWEYALSHVEEMITLILQDYRPELSRERLRYEALRMRGLIMPELVEYGHMSRARWQHMADTLVRTGMVQPSYSLEGFIYDPTPRPDFSRWQTTVILLLAVLAGVALVAGLLVRYNRRLQAAIRDGHEARAALNEKTALFQAIFDSMPDATVVSDTRRNVIMTNPAFGRTFGYHEAELVGRSFKRLYADPEDFEKQGRLRYNLQTTARLAPFEIAMRRKNGEAFPSLTQGAPVLSEDRQVLGFVAVIRDITEQKKAREEIERLALTDPVTGLANRHHFNQRFHEAVKLAERQDLWLSLAMMDLDLFKEVNDRFGHPVGDEVLVRVGQVLKRCFRESDVIARIGGDEFAVIIIGPESLADVRHLAERVIQAFAQPLALEGCAVQIGASFGIATYPLDATDPSELIRLADNALYTSKHQGRNICTLASEPRSGCGQDQPGAP